MGETTGVERLRELGREQEERSWSTVGKVRGRLMLDIADQIEREQGKHAGPYDYRRIRMEWAIRGVLRDMERHLLGHEGMEDSPVARWARELRGALEGRSDEEVEDVATVRADAMEAWRWVSEHGGLDHVRVEWNEHVPRDRYVRKRQRLLRHIAECETALGRRREIISKLGHLVSDLTTENAGLRRRAMPEGMEWPRYDTGELVDFGDEVDRGDGDSARVDKVVFYGDQWRLFDRYGCEINEDMMGPGDRVRRPAPAVPAADGEPLEVGQTVWHEDGTELRVLGFGDEEDGETIVRVEYASGPTRWGEVRSLSLTHTKPEPPDSWERVEEDAKKDRCSYFGAKYQDCGRCTQLATSCSISKARDLVRRCRALAERERGE